MAGNLSVERCGELFQNKERQASSNYGIGSDGRIGLYVDEANRSWCTSSASNDNRAVTIEVANTVAKDPWPVSDAAYKSLIDLLVDICQRNGIPKLLWKGDKNLVGQVDRQNMTVHRWFAAKACPGDWLYSHHGQIAAEVNKRLEAAEAGKDEEAMDTKQLTSCAD
ncbi:RNA polymerase sigma factor, partial [Dysosmobacter welbionis]